MRIKERRGCAISARGISEFCEFVEAAALSDVPIHGKDFTWFGSGNKCSRLDRFLVSKEWFECFDSLVLNNLPRELSDHSPILLVSDACDSGPKPFRFFNVWLLNPQHIRDMEHTWQGLLQRDGNDYLVLKMREMKRVLKEWNRDSFGNIDAQYREIIGEIEVLDARLNSDELGSNDLQHKRELYSRLWAVSRLWPWETKPERLKFLFARELRKHFERVPAAGMLEFNVAFSILPKNHCQSLKVEFTEAKVAAKSGGPISVETRCGGEFLDKSFIPINV
ncbi:hypothetical protein V6N13_063575 [Hibiscus sabdariffa]